MATLHCINTPVLTSVLIAPREYGLGCVEGVHDEAETGGWVCSGGRPGNYGSGSGVGVLIGLEQDDQRRGRSRCDAVFDTRGGERHGRTFVNTITVSFCR